MVAVTVSIIPFSTLSTSNRTITRIVQLIMTTRQAQKWYVSFPVLLIKQRINST